MKILGNVVLPIILVVAILFLIILIGSRQNHKGGQHYDEMQLKIRASGYRIGFLVTLAGLFFLILLTEVVDSFSKLISPSFGMEIVGMTGIVVFVVYCIFKDAFYSIGENKKTYMLICVAVIICNGIGSVRFFAEGMPADGSPLSVSNSGNLIMGISFLIILIALIIKNAQDRREAAE